MNIFYLSESTRECAVWHNDKHCVKMILEYGQLLSTAHRILDGFQENGRWQLPGIRNELLPKASHINHPCSKWVREDYAHYQYLYRLFKYLINEYNYRYEKNHKYEMLTSRLSLAPHNIPENGFNPPPKVVPEDCKCHSTTESYRNYYMKYKRHIAKWKKRSQPEWFV